MTYLEARARIFLSKRPIFYPWVQKIRGRTWGEYCTSETDLCIEGVESSANTFIHSIFVLLDDDLSIGHHTHVISNLKRARRYEIPTVVLYRKPSDAIPSLVSRFRPGVREAPLRYIHFYQYVLDHACEFMLVSFEEAISNVQDVIERVDSRWGFGFPSVDPDDLSRRAKERIEEWTKKHGNPDRISLPREERNRQKEAIRDRLRELDTFEKAKDIYTQLQDVRK